MNCKQRSTSSLQWRMGLTIAPRASPLAGALDSIVRAARLCRCIHLAAQGSLSIRIVSTAMQELAAPQHCSATAQGLRAPAVDWQHASS